VAQTTCAATRPATSTSFLKREKLNVSLRRSSTSTQSGASGLLSVKQVDPIEMQRAMAKQAE
jgi:hypothetical protein